MRYRSNCRVEIRLLAQGNGRLEENLENKAFSHRNQPGSIESKGQVFELTKKEVLSVSAEHVIPFTYIILLYLLQ